jgi:hypothetical protein
VRLRDGERVLDERADAALARVTDNRRSSAPTSGKLVLTNQRLVHLGTGIELELADIHELALAGDRLLVTLAGLRGVIIDMERAADFRSAIADAKSALRGR